MLDAGQRRRLLAVSAVAVAIGASLAAAGTSSAVAAASIPAYPAPLGCAPTPIASVQPNVSVCVHDLLVTSTQATAEQNSSIFTTVDSTGASLHGTVPNWWPSGGPVAGMVVTLWGKLVAGTFRTDHWLEWNHGGGPQPSGPYPRRRLLDVAAGKYPALEMTWVIAIPFALDPQQPPAGNDGDIHVQTMLPCPAGGLTFETTPKVRGYVDHPGATASLDSTNQADAPSMHLSDAPPVGVPVMMLGQLRYDFGFGWWEVHPIRAWRPLTGVETNDLAAECANAPVPVLDPTSPGGVLPYGFPPCTDGSEVGNPGGIYKACDPHCYVATTAIGQPETLAGHCAGVTGGPPVPIPISSSAPVTGTGRGPLPSTAAGPQLVGAALLVALVLGVAAGLWSRRRT